MKFSHVHLYQVRGAGGSGTFGAFFIQTSPKSELRLLVYLKVAACSFDACFKARSRQPPCSSVCSDGRRWGYGDDPLVEGHGLPSPGYQ